MKIRGVVGETSEESLGMFPEELDWVEVGVMRGVEQGDGPEVIEDGGEEAGMVVCRVVQHEDDLAQVRGADFDFLEQSESEKTKKALLNPDSKSWTEGTSETDIAERSISLSYFIRVSTRLASPQANHRFFRKFTGTTLDLSRKRR